MDLHKIVKNHLIWLETKFKKYNIEVLFLENAIKENLEITSNLTSTNDSQKGGSIIYGMWKASNENSNSNHIIIYTDADLSIHLSQIGDRKSVV